MNFGKEVIGKVYKFKVEMDDKEEALLKEYALKNIINDDEALLNYAVNRILKEMVNKGDKNEKENDSKRNI